MKKPRMNRIKNIILFMMICLLFLFPNLEGSGNLQKKNYIQHTSINHVNTNEHHGLPFERNNNINTTIFSFRHRQRIQLDEELRNNLQNETSYTLISKPDFTAGKTWYVDDDGDADFTRIQDAIDSTDHGDTVFVHSGLYHEHIEINKAIILQGEQKKHTIINGGGNRDVIIVLSSWVEIFNFTLTNGWDGIDIRNASNITINSNIIMNNEDGIDMRNDVSIVNITGNIIKQNEYYGIGIQETSSVSINENIIKNNDWDGINIDSSYNISITYNIINNNSDYGVILYNTKNNVITENIFYNNGITIKGSRLSHWTSQSINQNTINNKPIYFYKNNKNRHIPEDAGQIIIANCTNMNMNQLNILNAGIGIQIAFSSENIISDCNISHNNDVGIYIKTSHANTINKNIINENMYAGVEITDSMNNYLLDNNINKNGFYAITISYSSSNTFLNNIINDNLYGGLFFYTSQDNIIHYNLFEKNGIYGGLCLDYESNHNIIQNNNFVKNGLVIVNSYPNDINDNMINKKNLVYLQDQSNQLINNAGQVILINCDNIKVQDCNTSSATIGIELINTNDSHIVNNHISQNNNEGIFLSCSNTNKITTNNLSNNTNGINIIESHSNYLRNNTISNSVHDGISLTDTNHCFINENIITENKEIGISLENTFENYINDNHVTRCNHGIFLQQQSSFNQIKNNDLIENDVDGIVITSNSNNNSIISNTCTNNLKGISLRYSTQCFIEENNLMKNEQGILLNHVHNTIITENHCVHNGVGIYLYSSMDNTISNNSINHNNHKGIVLRQNSNTNQIEHNQIGPLNYQGIYIEKSAANNIEYNSIIRNNDDGIGLILTRNNQIHYNNIFENTDLAIQGMLCIDNACYNYWGNQIGPIFIKDIVVIGKIIHRPCLHQPITITTFLHDPKMNVFFQ